MGINKMMDNLGNIIFDLTEDDVSENNVAYGVQFHDKHGNIKLGKGATELVDDFDLFKNYTMFLNYDGTVFKIISKSDCANLTELPTIPDTTDLKFDGWNSTLEEVKAHKHPVVQPYFKTTDGCTHINITTTSANTTIDLQLSVISSLTVDWGDGSSTTSGTTKSHTYSAIGTYTIKVNSKGSKHIFKPKSTYIMSNNQNYNKLVNYIYLSEYVNALDGNACYYMYNLKTVTAPKTGLTYLGYSALGYCQSLIAFTVPTTVTTLYYSVFVNCLLLPYIILPDIITIANNNGNAMFQNCQKLVYCHLPSNLTVLYQGMFQNCYSLYKIDIPDTVTTLQPYVFQQCNNLREVYLPSSVTSIEASCFYYCYALSKVHLSPNIIELPAICFQYTYISYIKIPASVNTIGNQCFYGGKTSIIDLTSCGTPPTISSYQNVGYYGNTNYPCPLFYISKGSLDKYKTASNWSVIYSAFPSNFIEVSFE